MNNIYADDMQRLSIVLASACFDLTRHHCLTKFGVSDCFNGCREVFSSSKPLENGIRNVPDSIVAFHRFGPFVSKDTATRDVIYA
jgi:hypothetical protein